MINRKEVFDKINELKTTYTDLSVYQGRPEVIETFPTITFRFTGTPDYNLDKTIAKNNIQLVVDIWTKTPSEGELILDSLETKLKELDYLLAFSPDILDPGGTFHLTTQFIY
jgi:hypothetical protein